ncbi:MAG: TonB-dependent receptor, partial [Bacteroidales bacterium]|nr:TonB-dependent receptor [Bacteroidales bacterium]
SWYTLNIKSTYKLNRNVTLGGGIENILDKRYRAYSSGIVSSGLNVIFSVQVKI